MVRRTRDLSRNISRNISRIGIVNEPKSLFTGLPQNVKEGDIIKLKSGQELKVVAVSIDSPVKISSGQVIEQPKRFTIIGKDSSGILHKVNINRIHGVL
jgi:hypothetical protein